MDNPEIEIRTILDINVKFSTPKPCVPTDVFMKIIGSLSDYEGDVRVSLNDGTSNAEKCAILFADWLVQRGVTPYGGGLWEDKPSAPGFAPVRHTENLYDIFNDDRRE